jgi:O-antigen/teichoic acid export membrane protein
MTFGTIKHLLQNSLLKELSILFTGTAIAQTITLASLPILTYFFSPSQFGTFALFFTIVNAIGFISAGRFDAALMLPKNDKHAETLFSLGFGLCVCVSIFSGIVFALIPQKFLAPSIQKVLIDFTIELPISIFLVGIYTLLVAKHNRDRNYKQMATARIFQNITVSAISIGLGYVTFGTKGLVYGFMAGQLLSAMFLMVGNTKLFYAHRIKRNEIFQLVKEYASFPLYSVPMVLLNTISINILIFLLTIYAGSSFVGLYSQAYKAVSYPFFILSSSFVPIFYQRITVSAKKQKMALYTCVASIVIGLVFLMPVFLWGETLFAYVFGEKWRLSGHIAALLIPLSIASFTANNVSSFFAVLNKNHILLIWQVLYVTLAVCLIYMLRNGDKMQLIALFSWFGMIMYGILTSILLFIVKDTK